MHGDFDLSRSRPDFYQQGGQQALDSIYFTDHFTLASPTGTIMPPLLQPAHQHISLSADGSRVSTGSPNGIPPSSLNGSSHSSCNCLQDLLRISEESQYHSKNLDEAPLEKTLSIANSAIRICSQYVRCQLCAETLNSMLSVNALQQASACYRYLVDATLRQDERRSEMGDTGSREGSFHRVAIGSFECELSLHSDLWRSIISSEVQKATEIVARELGANDAAAVKKGRGIDDITANHHQAVLRRVADELCETLEILTRRTQRL